VCGKHIAHATQAANVAHNYQKKNTHTKKEIEMKTKILMNYLEKQTQRERERER